MKAAPVSCFFRCFRLFRVQVFNFVVRTPSVCQRCTNYLLTAAVGWSSKRPPHSIGSPG